jgi:glutathione S-transferase
MLELYHNGLSSCSQKVRLVLFEKGLDFESHDVDLVGGGQHDPDYVKLNPNHVVPTLVHDGHVLIESSLINEYLDETFPQVPMRPADAAGRHAMRLWVKTIDEKVHPAASILTYAIGPRKMMLGQPEDVREAYINALPDPKKREERRSVLENGVKAPEFAGALDRFLDLIDTMEIALAESPWLTGSSFGLADAAALPYVARLDQLAISPVLAPDVRPKVADWYARVQDRPTYGPAVTDWVPAPIFAMFRKNGEEVWADVAPLTRRG